MDSTQIWLGLYVFSFGVGAVLIGALTLTRLWTRIALAIIVALCAFAFMHSDEAAKPIFGEDAWWDFLIFNLIALGALVVGKGLRSLKDFGEFLSDALQPRKWPMPPANFSSMDIAKRWFVTVAAATGSLAFTLASAPEFHKLIFEHLTINRMVTTALVTIGSLVLIGPIEEFIFSGLHQETDEHHEKQPAHFERMLQTMSWRALGRILLVFLLILALNVAHSCLEEQLKTGDSQTTLTIVLSTAMPAVVTYFWCGALQTGVDKLALHATIGSVAAGMMLFLPFAVIAVFNDSVATGSSNNSASNGLWLLYGPFLVAALMGAVMIGLPAFCGGVILAIERRRPGSAPLRTIAFIAVGLSLLNTVLLLILLWWLSLQGADFSEIPLDELIIPGVASTFGWGAGLLVSGFPDIVRRAPLPAAPAVPAMVPTAD